MKLGVVTDEGEPFVSQVETALPDATVTAGSAASVLDADPEFVVAEGESALLALVRAGVTVPVLSVDGGRGVASIPESRLTDALASVAIGQWTPRTRSMLSVRVGGERVATALMDVMLVTVDPARISEYRVTTGDEPVAQFRADGVVVATPAGSHGYARATGGPLLAPGTGTVAAVPIAPFDIDPDHWVLGADDPLTLTVVRDEGDVTLLVDDREVGEVEVNEPVTVVADGHVTLVGVPETVPFFDPEP